ncbi:MAG: hypothetical protein ABL940_09245 [Bacteroidia bacterium]
MALAHNVFQLPVSVSFNQIMELIKNLPFEHKKKIVKELQAEITQQPQPFTLTSQQLALLDKRSKTSIENCITAQDSINQLKQKYGV